MNVTKERNLNFFKQYDFEQYDFEQYDFKSHFLKIERNKNYKWVATIVKPFQFMLKTGI